MARETSTNLEKEGDYDSGKPLQIISAVQTEFWLGGAVCVCVWKPILNEVRELFGEY